MDNFINNSKANKRRVKPEAQRHYMYVYIYIERERCISLYMNGFLYKHI